MATAIPALYATKKAYPAARLSLITWPHKQGGTNAWKLLEGADWIDEIIVYDRDDLATAAGKWKMLRDLRACRPDIWLEFSSNHWSLPKLLSTMLLARLSGARWAYGWQLSEIRRAAPAQSEWLDFPCEVERLLGIVQAAGIDCDGQPAWPLPICDAHRRQVYALLEASGLGGKHLIALAPGATRELNKWPLERFAAVGRSFADRGFGIAIVGGTDDSEACGAIASAVGSSAHSFAGRLSLLETCVLLSKCRLLIANDSDPQHLAAAAGTPTLSLFSFWQIRGKWRPWGERNVVLQKWVDCHTCYLSRCPYGNRCIGLIETDEVVATAERMLSEGSQAQSKCTSRNWRMQPSARESSARAGLWA